MTIRSSSTRPASASATLDSRKALLITTDAALARIMRRQVRDSDSAVQLEVLSGLEETRESVGYAFVTIDLDGAICPAEAVRFARSSWPDASVAVLVYRWSEGDTEAWSLADLVLHKPLRGSELRALLARVAAVPARQPARQDAARVDDATCQIHEASSLRASLHMPVRGS